MITGLGDIALLIEYGGPNLGRYLISRRRQHSGDQAAHNSADVGKTAAPRTRKKISTIREAAETSDSLKLQAMGRKQINFENMPCRVPTGTMKRMDRVLSEGEKRSDLLRAAVEAELQRRERTGPRLMSRRPLR